MQSIRMVVTRLLWSYVSCDLSQRVLVGLCLPESCESFAAQWEAGLVAAAFLSLLAAAASATMLPRHIDAARTSVSMISVAAPCQDELSICITSFIGCFCDTLFRFWGTEIIERYFWCQVKLKIDDFVLWSTDTHVYCTTQHHTKKFHAWKSSPQFRVPRPWSTANSIFVLYLFEPALEIDPH